MVNFSENYFSIFDMPISCEIDLELLGKKYRKLLMVHHPDRQIDNSKKLDAITTTSFINKAYNTLKNVDSRAYYLLKTSGFAANIEQISIKSPEFLEEQLSLRETIESFKTEKSSDKELLVIKSKVSADIKKYFAAFSKHFNQHTKEAIEKATQDAYKLRFLCKLQNTLTKLETPL